MDNPRPILLACDASQKIPEYPVLLLLHVSCERDGSPPRRIDKVKSFLDPLLHNFRSHYRPSQNLSGDETMVGRRGRFAPQQYIPSKPQKYGIKAFTLADSANGYMLNIVVYTGADTLDEADPNYRNLPQPGRVVLHLLQPYLDKGYHVYIDRYYTSIPLAHVLQVRSTAFTGTAVRNRANLPDAIRRPSRLADNEVRVYRADRFLALEWRAPAKKKSLVMLSTQSSAQMATVRVRWNQELVEKPVVVNEYNHSMNGVDVADQNSVYYRFIRKTRKWWRKLFFWLLEVTVVNSYVLYQAHAARLNIRPLTHLQFRRKLVEALALNISIDSSMCSRRGHLGKSALSVVTGARTRDVAATFSAKLARLLLHFAHPLASRSIIPVKTINK